jgi:plastocyanin
MVRFVIVSFAVVALLVSAAPNRQVAAQVTSDDTNIAVMDDCDPSDPLWNTLGGCTLRKGSVSVAEFASLLFSPLSGTIPVGHPSWRNEPAYVSTRAGRIVRARNWGGRTHTFTEVADFGGGFVADLNGSLDPAPQCNPAEVEFLAPGASVEIELAAGTHKFQCCIHPWMRAAVEVK